MSLQAVRHLVGEPSHDQFYPKPDGTREAMFEPRVRDSSREVGAGLRCHFGPDYLLSSCEVHVGPFHTQFVGRDQVAELKSGQGIGEVFERLCTPGRIDLLPAGGLQALYFFREGGTYGAQAVSLDFNKAGRLSKVGFGH